jgi:hypothetical protein
MKVNPGDIIIDKKLNRTLTVLDVEKTSYASIGNYNVEYDLVCFMDSSQSQSIVNKVYEYELDVWDEIELIRVSK